MYIICVCLFSALSHFTNFHYYYCTLRTLIVWSVIPQGKTCHQITNRSMGETQFIIIVIVGRWY